MVHVDALLSKWVAKALEDTHTKWVDIFFALIKEFSWEQRRSQNRAQYTDVDRIIFGEVKAYGAMHYFAEIWNVWEALRRHMLLSPTGNLLPTQWRISDIVHALNKDHTVSMNKTLGKLGITQAEDLWDTSTNSWKDFEENMTRLSGIPQWLKTLTSEFLEAVTKVENLSWNAPIDLDL